MYICLSFVDYLLLSSVGAPVLDQFLNCIFSKTKYRMKEMLFLLFHEEYDTWEWYSTIVK